MNGNFETFEELQYFIQSKAADFEADGEANNLVEPKEAQALAINMTGLFKQAGLPADERINFINHVFELEITSTKGLAEIEAKALKAWSNTGKKAVHDLLVWSGQPIVTDDFNATFPTNNDQPEPTPKTDLGILEQLCAPFPEAQIKQDYRGNDYVKSVFIENRLNEVLGIDGWQKEIRPVSENTYIVAIIATINDKEVRREAVGFWGEKKEGTDIMGGESKAFRRAARAFGIGKQLWAKK